MPSEKFWRTLSEKLVAVTEEGCVKVEWDRWELNSCFKANDNNH